MTIATPSTSNTTRMTVQGTISSPLRSAEEAVLSPMSRHNIQLLRFAGLTQEAVADIVGCTSRTVARIEKEPAVDPMQPRDHNIGRPSKAEAYIPFVVGQLAEQPDVQSGELLRRARELPTPYAGRKSAFYAMVAGVRSTSEGFITRFEGLPGEFSQHDFGTVVVTFLDGSEHRVKFFASRLKYSRFAAVTVVPDETAETLVRTLLEHFVVFGGIPMLAVFDRPKTVAVSWRKDGTITQWNQDFAAAAMDIGFTAEVCWAYCPNQKGSVENIVGWVKSSFFKQRKFLDHDDLLRQLDEWLEEANGRRKSRATGRIPAELREGELPRLRAPRVTCDELALRHPVVVPRTGVVTFEDHQYVVHPDLRGRHGTMFVHRDRVRIQVDSMDFEYSRKPESRRVSTSPSLREAQLAELRGRGRKYGRREHLLHIGGVAERFLTELVHGPHDWGPAVERLHELLQRHGEDAMERAMRAALDVGAVSEAHVARLLGEAA